VRTLLRTGEAAGVIFLPASRVTGADQMNDGVAIRTEREAILAGQVVNAAGLYADDVSRILGGEKFTIYPCRGEYAELTPAKRAIVNHLVYPVPDPSGHGLGVHLVKTLAGAVWLGPTIKYQERKDDYEHDRLPVEAFVEPAQRILKGVELQDLRLSGSGIRAKLHPPSESFADFFIARDRQNPALIQVSGIDSPGLTSSLAIGGMVGELVASR
jgi:glycerol-3-phosphate dehydrogenase